MIQVYTVLTLLVFGHGNEDVRLLPILQRLALNPFLLACALGLLLNVTGVPDFVYQTFSVLGAASIPLTMLAVGAGLNLAGARASWPIVTANSAVRLFGMPALVLLLCWLTGLSGMARSVTVIAAGVPTAATAYTMARKMGGDAALMAQLITFQSAASAVTLPLVIWVAQST